jgi:hypothetical protein
MGLISWLIRIFSRQPILVPAAQPPTDQEAAPTITFPPQQAVTLDGVRFPADVDGKRIRCEITVEALQDHFGLQGSDFEGAFLANRGGIQMAAMKLIYAHKIDRDGVVRIRSSDI